MDVGGGNYVVKTDDNFNSLTVFYNGDSTPAQTSPKLEFKAGDEVPSANAIAGTQMKSWSTISPDGTRNSFDLIKFTNLSLTYIDITALYRRPPSVDLSTYSFRYTLAAISDEWTRPEAMPTTGTATYQGLAYGASIGYGTYRTISQFQMTADFAAARVSGSIDTFKFYDFSTGASVPDPYPVPPGFALTFDTTIATPVFSTFSDQLKINGVNSGRVEGHFAGPAAQEVGGAYSGYSSGFSVFGVFAGKQ